MFSEYFLEDVPTSQKQEEGTSFLSKILNVKEKLMNNFGRKRFSQISVLYVKEKFFLRFN